VSSVSAAANTLTLDGHGLVDDAEVSFRAEAGGSLPTGLSASTPYYAIVVSESVFQVAAADGGAAIDITTAGSNVIAIVPLPVDECIAWGSNMVENMCPGHVRPLADEGEYPDEVVRACAADLAASRLLAYCGASQIDIQAKIAGAQKIIDRWAKAIPIRGANAPGSTNLAVVASAAVTDSRGWMPSDGTIP
jgi:hypothetical protein